jgi:PAS domain S-box-containing protein
MKQQVDGSPGVEIKQINSDRRLRFILQQIASHDTVDVVCVYVFHSDSSHLRLWMAEANEQRFQSSFGALSKWLQDQLDDGLMSEPDSTHEIPLTAKIEEQPYQVTLYPTVIYDGLVSIVAIFSHPHEYQSDDEAEELRTITNIAHMIVENTYLAERLIATESIAMTAQAVADNPSPQNIVRALSDLMFDKHISSCLIALFGPVGQDNPRGPFEYVEIKGSWSRRVGSEIGVGTRINLSDHAKTLEILDEKKCLIISDMKQAAKELNSFNRMMIEVDKVQSIALILLESERSKLGILAITTDEVHKFPLHELRGYQIVGEFLTMSTLTSVLQQQSEFVQRGRSALLDAVTDGVIMVLPDETANVLTVNKQFTAMFGLKESQVQGISLNELLEKMPIPGAVRHELYRKWKSVLSDDVTNLRGEFRMTSADSMLNDISWYSGPVYQNDEVIGYIYTLHDITPERTAQRLRSELLSRISHELRTPLTSIHGFAEFILEVTGDELPALAREYTEIIHTSASHLNHLFNDMIEFSRANAGEMKLNKNNANILDIVAKVVKRLKLRAKEREQNILVKSANDLPQIHVDIDRMEQVVSNLISNAIKYSPQGGEIHVSVEYVEDPQYLPSRTPAYTITPCIVVKVVDQGNGLSQKHVDDIFLPFYRTKNAKKQKIEGTGLGLAISHSIVELHRGQIWARPASRKHPGGQFFVAIPLLDLENK